MAHISLVNLFLRLPKSRGKRHCTSSTCIPYEVSSLLCGYMSDWIVSYAIKELIHCHLFAGKNCAVGFDLASVLQNKDELRWYCEWHAPGLISFSNSSSS